MTFELHSTVSQVNEHVSPGNDLSSIDSAMAILIVACSSVAHVVDEGVVILPIFSLL